MLQLRASRLVTGGLAAFLLTAAWPGSAGVARAESLEASLSQLSGVRVTLLERIDDWKSRPRQVVFPIPLLEEFALTEFSRWRLEGSGDWELRDWETLDTQGAFGMFAEQRARWSAGGCAGETLDLPFDNLLCKGELAFWRGSHFLLLRPLAGDSADSAGFAGFAIGFQDAIQEPNLYPFSVVQLPLLDLHAESVRLFLGENGLRSDELFPKGLIPRVGFDKQVEVVSARYGPDNRPLFLFGYPTASLAQEQAAKLNGSLPSYYFPEGVLLKRSALLVALYFGPEAEGRATLDQVHYDAKVKWIYDRGMSEQERQHRRGELISFFGIVTASVYFTAFFAVAVVILGVCVGLLRYQVIQRFPIVTERNDMIRLDLR